MSNFICEMCGAVYIDEGQKGYKRTQNETTAELVKSLNDRNKLLQNINSSMNDLLSQKDEAIVDLTADKIELKQQLTAKETQLSTACMKINAANTAAAANLALCKETEMKLQAAVNQYDAVVKQNKDLQQELLQTKEWLKPFNDTYFSKLSYEHIAELAKKSIRITADNREFKYKIGEIQEQIKNHCSECGCRYDCENHNLDDLNGYSCILKELKKIVGCSDDTET